MPESVNTHMTPVALKINACVDPIGIDTPRPLFQWMLCAQRGNCYQSAYRIVVMDDSGNTVWDILVRQGDRGYYQPGDRYIRHFFRTTSTAGVEIKFSFYCCSRKENFYRAWGCYAECCKDGVYNHYP